MGLAISMELRKILLRILRDTLSKRMPGYLEMLNSMARSRYGLEVVDLMLTSPCKLYELLREHYGVEVAKFLMSIIIKSLPSISASNLDTAFENGCNDEVLKKVINDSLQYYIENQR